MKISLNWINSILNQPIEVDPIDLADKLSLSLAEVEDVKKVGEEYNNIVVAEILDIKKIENSDKLQHVLVDYGEDQLWIVCGADNIEKGQKVPLVKSGTKLPNGYKIEKTLIRGVESDGMICSQKELSLGEDNEGIMILSEIAGLKDENLQAGTPLSKALNLKDTILEIENKALTHRPDCFSHIGIAREIGALTDRSLVQLQDTFSVIPTEKLDLEVKVEEPELCPRYSAIVIKDIEIKPSPLWLRYLLQNIGIRPKNNIVDITNYIMWYFGQPLHAFDLDKLDSSKIVVRKAKRGESIRTLDDEQRKLDNDMLLITNGSKPIAIAGIMGGLDSEITDSTKSIVIESANFEMFGIRKTSAKLGLRTDASTIFEKGQDPNKTVSSLKHAVDLILDLAGGDIATEIIDIYPDKRKERKLEFRNNLIRRKLGYDIDKTTSINILESLGIKVENKENLPDGQDFSKYTMTLTIPTYRPDLTIEEDILEELGRIYGYDKFMPTLPTRNLKTPKKNTLEEFTKTLIMNLASSGMHEIYTYAFIGKKLYERCNLDANECIKIINPISEDAQYCRNSIIPSILSKAQQNATMNSSFRLFEISRIYIKGEMEESEDLPRQPFNVAGLSYGKNSYYDLKSRLDNLFAELNIKIRYKNAGTNNIDTPGYLIALQTAVLYHDDTRIGFIGNILPEVRGNFDLDNPTTVFEINLDILKSLSNQERPYEPISKFPSTKRDLSFLVDYSLEIGEFLERIEEEPIDEISKIDLIDVYENANLRKKGKKSVTIRLTIRSKTKTLSEEEITSVVDNIIDIANRDFEAKLRE